MAHVQIEFEVPDETLKDLLQIMRDFEQRDPKRHHLHFLVTAPDLTLDDVTKIYKQIRPPFKYNWIFRSGAA